MWWCCCDLKAPGARVLASFGEHVRRSKTIRPLIGTTCEVRHLRKAGRCVTGRREVECMTSRAASMGIMSPSWTLGKRVSDEYFQNHERRIDVFRYTQEQAQNGRRVQDSYRRYGVANEGNMCAKGTGTPYKLKKSFPASGPFPNRSAVAFNQSQPIVAPKRLPGPAR